MRNSAPYGSTTETTDSTAKRRFDFLPVVVVSLALIAGGVGQGLLTHRWTQGAEIEAAARNLERIPHTFGDWRSEAIPVSPEQMKIAEAAGYFSRLYVNDATHQVVHVLIVCGAHGPISVHPPTVCFTSQGFRLAAPESRYLAQNRQGESIAAFWQGDFIKQTDGVPQRIRAFWSWSGTGAWQAPDHPRLTFVDQPALYKLYLTHDIKTADEPLDEDPAVAFMPRFLSELQKVLFNGPSV
jgi:hypothetical protein